jgi:hypothetical protein
LQYERGWINRDKPNDQLAGGALRKLAFFFLILVGAPTFAQTTSVSGTVADTTSQAFAYGTWKAQLVGPSGYTGNFFYNGTQLGQSDIQKSGTLNASGAMSTTAMYSNNLIAINGGVKNVTLWTFTVCPGASASCFSISLNITGASYSITGNIVPTAISVPASIGNQPSAYSDSEISGGVLGFAYFNLTDQTLHICGPPACTWINIGGSSFTGFNVITSGTNTAAAMVIGTGASLGVSGSGTIAATTSVALASNPTTCTSTQAAIGILASGNATGCFTPAGTTPAGSTNDVQTNAGGGSLGSGVSGTANVGKVGNIFVKPASADSIEYVTPEGNDSNDGLSWGSAKLTLFGACEALPGGATSPATCGKGTVFFTSGVHSNPTSADGLWLMGTFDPNYASPPTGWLRIGGQVQFVGVGCPSSAANSQIGQCSVLGGSQSDNVHPAMWLSGLSASTYFANMLLPSNITGIRLAIDSTGNRSSTSGQVVNALFYNVAAQMGLAPATNGPTVDIGANSFFNGFRNCNFAGNANAPAGSDLAASILMNPGTGAGVGIIYIEDTNLAGGYLKFYPGTNGGGFYLSGTTIEALTGTNGGIWITGTNSNVNIAINNFQLADTVGNAPSVEVDGNGPPDAVIVSNTTGPLVGPMVFNGLTPASLSASTIIPSKYHQQGFAGGHVLGQTDVARRVGSMTAVRFTNIALTNPASWTASGGGSIATGVTDILGGTNAATCSSSSGNVNCLFSDTNITYAVGDIVVIGAWARSRNGNGFRNALSIFLANSGFTLQDISGQGSSLQQPSLPQYISGDGTSGSPPSQWDWYWEVFKVKTIGTNPTETQFIGPVDNTHPTDYFAPIFLHIPVGTVSDNEASELGLNLQPYDHSCAVGSICGLTGQKHEFVELSPSVAVCTDASSNLATSGCPSAGTFYQTIQANGTPQTQQATANYVAGANMTITPTTVGGVTTLTFTSSATAATAWSAITASTNSNAGTFVASGNSWDFSAASSFKVPTVGLIFPGSASGSVTVVPQAAAGTPTVTWGTASGTPVVTASAPLSITAATGNETIASATTGALGVVELTNDLGGTALLPTVLSTHITSATTNRIVKFSSGNLVNTAASEASSVYTIPEILDLTTFPLTTEIANEGATGTTINKFASLTGAPSTAIVTSMGVTGAIGIVAGGAGTTGSAQIATSGQVNCVFDGGTTAGHFVTISATVNGDCTDNGTTAPASMPTVIVLSTNVGAGTYAVSITGGSSGSGSGSGTVNNCATSGAVAYYASNGTAVSCLASITESAGVISLGIAGTTGGQLKLSGSTSGTITIQPQNAAGTYNWNLPITAGTSTFLLTSAGGAGSPMTWTSPTITINGQAATLGSTATIPFITNGNGGNTSQAGLELDNSVSNSVGGTITLTNTGTNKVKFEFGGTVNPTGGGTGISNPTAHSLLVAEGASNMNLITSPIVNGTYLCGFFVVASAAVDPACNAVGVPVNAQTGVSYTIAAADRTSDVSMNNAGAVAVTLPQAGSTGFGSNFTFVMPDIGLGAATITPTTSTINGASTLLVPQFWVPFVYSDNTNYTAYTFPDYRAFANTGSNSAMTFNSTTGAFGALSNISNCAPTRAGDIAYWNGSAYACLAGNNSGTQALEENASGVPSWVTITGTGTVTSVGLTVNSTSPSGIFTVTGSPVTSAGTLNFNLAGTSGGVPYFSSATVLSSSAALAANAVVIGGGAGAAPASISADTTTTHALFATATAPAFRAIVAGDLPNIPLNQVISPTGAITEIQDGDNALSISSATTTSGRVAVTLGEHTASTSAGTPYQVEIKTLIGSTATPLKVDNSLNGSQALPTVSILPTWNTTGVPTALLINPTNTASGTGSLLIQAQTGGTNEFTLDKSGNGVFTAGITGVSLTLSAQATLAETTAPSASSTNDICYGDSTLHGLKCSYNNGSFLNLPLETGTMTSGDIAVVNSTTNLLSDGGGPPPATLANASHKWLNSYTSTTGLFTQTQPAASDLSVAALANGITATTQAANSNDTKLATDAYVDQRMPIIVLDTSSPVTVGSTNVAVYHNNQTTGSSGAAAITYNLPTAAAGIQKCFTNSYNGTQADTGVITIATSASGQFIIFTDGTLSATGGTVTSGGAAADAACVVGIDATHWQLYVQRGTWTKH